MNHSALAGERSRAVPRVLLRVLLANLVVVAAKAAVGFATGSLAVLGDALHASVDAGQDDDSLPAITTGGEDVPLVGQVGRAVDAQP